MISTKIGVWITSSTPPFDIQLEDRSSHDEADPFGLSLWHRHQRVTDSFYVIIACLIQFKIKAPEYVRQR